MSEVEWRTGARGWAKRMKLIHEELAAAFAAAIRDTHDSTLTPEDIERRHHERVAPIVATGEEMWAERGLVHVIIGAGEPS